MLIPSVLILSEVYRSFVRLCSLIKEEIEQPGYEDYGMNDLVGKSGLKKCMNII